MTRIPDLGADGNIVTVPSSAPAIHVEGLVKRFGTTTALAGVDLRSRRAASSGCSDRTARARRPWCGCLPPCSRRTPGAPGLRPRRGATMPPAVRELLGLTGQFAAVDEMLTGRENLEMFGRLFDLSRQRARRARPNCWSASTWPMPPTAGAGRTPAACADGSTSPRACSTRPRVLFLDEPTTGLDPRSRNEIWSIVRELVARGDDAPPHHPVPRGGRSARRPHRGDRPRPRDRAGYGKRAQGPDRRPDPGGRARPTRRNATKPGARCRVGCGDPEPGERPDG